MNNEEKIFWCNCLRTLYGTDFNGDCDLMECICIRDEIIQMLIAMLETFEEYTVSDLSKLLVIEFQRNIGNINWYEGILAEVNELAIEFDVLYDEVIDNG